MENTMRLNNLINKLDEKKIEGLEQGDQITISSALAELVIYQEYENIVKLMEDRDTIMFECKQEFAMDEWDNDNDCFFDIEIIVTLGSVWQYSEKGYNLTNRIKLKNSVNEWIVISKETLINYFQIIL